MHRAKTFGAFLTEKRRGREITSLQMSELAGISPGYYCDIEKSRRVPPDNEVLDKILAALRLSDEDRHSFYDLAGRARSGVSPDLPDYIMGNDVVRVALRVAKDKASADDWRQFIEKLESK
jgi:transcriptional regulator with XRE-family HTH domain